MYRGVLRDPARLLQVVPTEIESEELDYVASEARNLKELRDWL